MASFASLAKLINEASKVKAEPEEFLSMYHEAVKRLDVPRKPSACYHPSSIGGCSRNLYFQLVSEELDSMLAADPQLQEIGASGSAAHERIQQNIVAMQKLGYPVEWMDVSKYLEEHPALGTVVRRIDGLETLLFNEIYNLSFKCDGIIRLNGLPRILEIKTEVEMKWVARNAPVEEHIAQGIAYSLGLGIEEILYVYENRNTCAKKAYLHKVSSSQKHQMSDKIARIDSFVADGKVPPKEESVSNCKYCNYKRACIRW